MSFIPRMSGREFLSFFFGRILVHGTNFSLDLDYGNSANLTKIQLWGSWPGANQIWALTERVSIADQHTYSLRNRQGGTAVDLSGGDNHSIISYYPHDGSNQAWIFQSDGDDNGWFIKSSRSGQYLGIEGSPNNGTAVVAVPSPFKWDVKVSDVEGVHGIRILIHGTNFSLDLECGNSANLTKIQLWGSWPGANQIWGFIERQ
ncbi:ricin B lectin domain-containing protein [Suillus subluteus]|nr:ricin B lectin domain-containing protein [Suillus subluteus]